MTGRPPASGIGTRIFRWISGSESVNIPNRREILRLPTPYFPFVHSCLSGYFVSICGYMVTGHPTLLRDRARLRHRPSRNSSVDASLTPYQSNFYIDRSNCCSGAHSAAVPACVWYRNCKTLNRVVLNLPGEKGDRVCRDESYNYICCFRYLSRSRLCDCQVLRGKRRVGKNRGSDTETGRQKTCSSGEEESERAG